MLLDYSINCANAWRHRIMRKFTLKTKENNLFWTKLFSKILFLQLEFYEFSTMKSWFYFIFYGHREKINAGSYDHMLDHMDGCTSTALSVFLIFRSCWHQWHIFDGHQLVRKEENVVKEVHHAFLEMKVKWYHEELYKGFTGVWVEKKGRCIEVAQQTKCFKTMLRQSVQYSNFKQIMFQYIKMIHYIKLIRLILISSAL